LWNNEVARESTKQRNARGEIPIWLSSTAFRSYSESLIQKRQYQPRFQPASFIAVRIIHIPGISIHMPGIRSWLIAINDTGELSTVKKVR
jgi:hypothetical protein